MPEGGQHQSVNTPLIGMAADRLASFEPTHVDELAILLRHALEHMQQSDGSAVWLRLSTRTLAQSDRADPAAVIAGAHWVVPPAEGGASGVGLPGPVATEVIEAFEAIAEDVAGAGLLAITSPDRLHAGWLNAMRARREGDRSARSHIERILAPLAPGAGLTVLDGHPATHAWLGSVRGQRKSCLWASIISARGRHSGPTARMGWTPTRFWMRVPRCCWCNESGEK